MKLSTPRLPAPHFDEAACWLRLVPERAALSRRHTPVKDAADRLVLRVVVLSTDEV